MAAQRLFTEDGWHTTGMRDVAAAAGVATETVYAYFSSKRALLEAVVDTATAGDEVDVAIADRPGFAAIGRGRRGDRCAAAAKLLTDVQRRTSRLTGALRDAAAADGEIAAVLRDTRERRRRDVAAAAALIAGSEVSDVQRDGVWALTSPEVYELLVDESGWTDDRYEAWVADTLGRVLPRPSSTKENQQ
jgi:AcrR family transcriptional regulator